MSTKINKKPLNKLLKQKLKNKNISKINNQQISEIIKLNKKSYFRKSRPEHEGEEVQIDACKDYWIDNKQSHLHAAYDPATRTILALHLEKEKTTHGYYKLLETLLLEEKTPEMFMRYENY